MTALGLRKIYVASEDSAARKFLRDFFEINREFSPAFCSSTDDLVKRMKKSAPDAIVTDSATFLTRPRLVPEDTPVILVIPPDGHGEILSAASLAGHCLSLSPMRTAVLRSRLNAVIRRKDGIESLYQEKRDLEAILELSSVVSSTLNPREVLFTIVRKISELMHVTRCSILSLEGERNDKITVIASFEDPEIHNIVLDLNRYPEIKRVISSRRPVIIHNAQSDRLMRPVKRFIAPIGIKAIMVLFIIFRNEVIGTLFLRTSRAAESFSQREINLCKAVANISANALFNAFSFKRLSAEKERLSSLAITDYLTGIFNVRYLYHRLEEEMNRAGRYGSTIGCIMMDIDFFKKINDTYGHKTGDKVLHEFAQLVKKHTRRSDIFARYGGEEFILIMPNTTSHGSKIEAERLLKVVRNHRFKGLKKGAITVSIGLAHFPDRRIASHEDLITLADNALFEAKNQGRNTIVVNHRHVARPRASGKKASR